MFLTDKILNLLSDNQLSLKQLYKLLPEETEPTVRGRLSELAGRSLVKKFNGNYVLTIKGVEYLNKDDINMDIIYDENECIKYNFIAMTPDKNTPIWAKNEEDASKLAKLIYGTNYVLVNIGRQ